MCKRCSAPVYTCILLEKPQETVNLKDVWTNATLEFVSLFCFSGLVHILLNDVLPFWQGYDMVNQPTPMHNLEKHLPLFMFFV